MHDTRKIHEAAWSMPWAVALIAYHHVLGRALPVRFHGIDICVLFLPTVTIPIPGFPPLCSSGLLVEGLFAPRHGGGPVRGWIWRVAGASRILAGSGPMYSAHIDCDSDESSLSDSRSDPRFRSEPKVR
eukprot:872766-Amorphochlora_amoeboformis.AAC.1